MSDDRTIFGRILDGDLPCHRVHEDDHVLAFLDINPLSRGHTLLIPKQRVSSLRDLDDDFAAALGRVVPRLCRAIARVTGTDDLNVLVNDGERAGQEVMHVHLHLIPRSDEGGLRTTFTPGSLGSDEGARIASEIAEMMREG